MILYTYIKTKNTLEDDSFDGYPFMMDCSMKRYITIRNDSWLVRLIWIVQPHFLLLFVIILQNLVFHLLLNIPQWGVMVYVWALHTDHFCYFSFVIFHITKKKKVLPIQLHAFMHTTTLVSYPNMTLLNQKSS